MQNDYVFSALVAVDDGEQARIAAFVSECEKLDRTSACFQPEVVVDSESGKPSFVV